MARVGLVFGGRSVEHMVSLRSARTVDAGLRQAGHEVVPLPIAEDGTWLAPAIGQKKLDGEAGALSADHPGIAGSVRHLVEARVDAVFPIVHGTFGEDGALQGLCEMLDIPYVGAGVAASAVAMDKLISKRVFENAGLPVVEYTAITRHEFESAGSRALATLAGKAPPLFVKPSVGGSSVGCKKVDRVADLADAVRFALRFDDTVLVEKGVKAREVEVAVLGLTPMRASVVGEIVPGNDFYDYEDKYLKDNAKLLAPAPVSAAVSDRLRDLAVKAFAAIGGSGMARVDFFLVGEDVYLNEINTLPGFTSVSMYPRLWGLTGVPLPALVDELVKCALARAAARRKLDDGIKQFVREVSKT